jgi:hypothetical protein
MMGVRGGGLRNEGRERGGSAERSASRAKVPSLLRTLGTTEDIGPEESCGLM